MRNPLWQPAACVLLLLAGPASAQSPPGATLVLAGRLLDPRTGSVRSPAAVLVQDGKLKEVGPPEKVKASAPAGASVIDLGSATLLPGLIDSHTHLLIDVTVPTESESSRRFNGDFVPGLLLAIAGMSPSTRVLLGAQLAREDLQAGFTTVRNLGHSGIDGDTALRDAINAGRVPGPRLLASGRKLTSVGGYFQSLNPALAPAIIQQEFLEVRSPEGARVAVQEDAFIGADWIKVAVEDDLTPAEMAAIVDEAHHQHLKVAVHVFPPSSIQMAIDAGADSIEHGNGVTDAQLKQMRTKGMFFDFTPTWYDGFASKVHEASIVMSPALRS